MERPTSALQRSRVTFGPVTAQRRAAHKGGRSVEAADQDDDGVFLRDGATRGRFITPRL